MRALPALLLGAVAYVAFLVGTVPATLVTGEVARVAAGRVEFDRVEGTAWNGRAAVRLRSGGGELSLDEVAWRFLPANLFAGEAAFAIQAKRAGLDAAFVVARSPAETRLREVKATGAAASFTSLYPLAASWQPEGTIALESDEFAISGSESRGAARIEWREAALSLANARPLGSWKADLTGKGVAIEIALATVKGPLRLAGKGSLPTTKGAAAFQFSGTASADPGREKELEALLALIGPRRPDGLHAIAVR